MKKIVTVAGGKYYGCNAYASIRLLRYLGCNIPVEWYYLCDIEMPSKWLRAAESIPDVKCINLNTGASFNKRERGGWQAKIEAIIASTADELLFLDADNFVWRDPTYLFESPIYLEYGAVLWPDTHKWQEERHRALNAYFGVFPQHEYQVESGQLLFNKNKCHNALEKILEYNRDSKRVYELVYGDKDTFYFGFLATGTPFNLIRKQPLCSTGCLLQHDPDDNILFTHLTGGKFAPHGRPFTDEASLPHLNKCRDFLAELRALLVNN